MSEPYSYDPLEEWLLDNGANINLQSANGFTALHWAVLSNDSNKVDFLLQQGADPNDPEVQKMMQEKAPGVICAEIILQMAGKAPR